MRPQYVGYIRAARGQRLTGNRAIIESEPSTRTDAETWLNSMLESCVEEGAVVAEAGTRKYEPKTKTRRARKTGKSSKETGHSAENETETRFGPDHEALLAEKAQPRRRSRARPAHRKTDHAASARAHAK